jgi:REP element-mobilizing transposase RayT
MPTYVRWREHGATYFFTVVTYRRQRILTGRISRHLLMRAVASVRRRHPFDMHAYVLLPDHLHCIAAMPNGDDDFPTRWRQIKSLFTRGYLAQGGRDWDVTRQSRRPRDGAAFGNLATGSTKSATTMISSGIEITSITIRSKINTSSAPRIGLARVFTNMFEWVGSIQTGREQARSTCRPSMNRLLSDVNG